MVYLRSLNKNILPCFVKPGRDELFSSWLCRLSYNHGVKTNTLIANYFDREMSIWNRDIDLMYNQRLIDTFSEITPLSTTEIKKLFLESYDSFVTHIFRSTGTIQNILPLGINHRKRSRFGMQCCTSCLTNSPYYKKSWRLVSSVICTSCNSYLIDHCFNCGAPIAYFRVNIDTNLSVTEFQSFCLCYNCKIDLRSYKPEKKPTSIEIDYQRFIDKTIDNGYNSITQYSFTYIRVLLVMSMRLCSASKDNRLRRIVQKKLNISLPTIEKEIKFWSVEERLMVLPLVYSLLKDYPDFLNILFKNGNVIQARVFNDRNYVPYWLVKCFKY